MQHIIRIISRKDITRKTCFFETYLCKEGKFIDLYPAILLQAYKAKQSIIGSR